MKYSNAQKPLLTGARQTMLSWVKVIESFGELPAAYKSTVGDLLRDEQKFPYTLFTPPVSGSRFDPAEKLLLWFKDTLYILEEKAEEIEIIGYPNQLIGHLERGSILLYSWFTVSGINIEGDIVASTVVYNTATHRHIQPFLDKIRSLPANRTKLNAERADFDYLSPLNFKFFNFARNSLKGNEKVIASLWQPEISHNVFPFFKRTFKRLLSPAHITILTDYELILIENDYRSIEKKGKRYGGVWRYIPRKSILFVDIVERKNNLLSISFNIKPNTFIERIYGADQRLQVMQLKAELKKSMRQEGIE